MRQVLEGFTDPAMPCRLAISLETKDVVVQASQEAGFWQELARFPRSEFTGDPTAVRIGKMSPGARNEDFSTPGPAGLAPFASCKPRAVIASQGWTPIPISDCLLMFGVRCFSAILIPRRSTLHLHFACSSASSCPR